MSIEQALERFERVMSHAWPEPFAALLPGLDDDGIARLRAAVAPFVLPHQVEALYRWRAGGDAGVFGGWRMLGLDELISWYEFTVSDLEQPRIWLPVFDDQMVNVVTMDHPGGPPSDTSVWYGHTHDASLDRLFDSLESLLDVVSDAAEADLLSLGARGNLGLPEPTYGGQVSLDGTTWTELRLRRCPGAYRWPDPPPGTQLSRFPDPGWPRPWLLAVGVTEDGLTPRGATHTIAELVAAAADGPAEGTIRGRVITGSGGGGWWNPVVSDGTSDLVVCCDTRSVPVTPNVGDEAEFDVILDSPLPPAPVADEDPVVAAVASRLRPAIPTAVARAARPL